MDEVRPGEKIRWWRPSDLPGVEILDARHSDRLWVVFHQTYTLCQIRNIEGPNFTQWRYRGGRLWTQRGGVMAMEPGEVHVTEKIGGPGDFWVLLLDPAWFARLQEGDHIPRLPHLKQNSLACPKLSQAMLLLYAALQGQGSRLEKETHLLEVMRLIVEDHAEPMPVRIRDAGHKALARAKEYLRAHFVEEVSLETLSQEAAVNPCYLNRLFQKHMGVTPTQFQNALRVEKAKSELAGGSPISLVEAGFSSQSYLTRVFKEMTGVTPGQYRDSIRGTDPGFRNTTKVNPVQNIPTRLH